MNFITKQLSESEKKVGFRDDVIILMAEDDNGHYILAEHYLRNAGVTNEIIWFRNGQETLDYLFHSGLDLVEHKYIAILDIRMPKVSGLEVLERMKADNRCAEIPVIMFTTSEDMGLTRLCMDMGCEAKVVKPPGKTLLNALEKAVRGI